MSTSPDCVGFDALYERTRTDVLAYLLRRCTTAEDAADCLAETYLVAWQKRGGIPEGELARLWLFGVARNMIRQGRRRQQQLEGVADELGRQLRTAHAVRAASGDREADRLRDAMNTLSELDREIITMIAWDELTPGEVATVLELSPNVVRVRLHRTRAKLRAALASQVSSESVNLP
jgi:RNA polymerase sigma-70 factor (ECF subfamily)